MKVLVTGATGFLGSRLVSALAARGDAVRALSRGNLPEGRTQAYFFHALSRRSPGRASVIFFGD